MNCSQARVMLATYRELKDEPGDTTALDEHLADCAACRAFSAQSSFIGERVRALPQLEPDPAAHTKLMQALAAEHMHFIQRAPASATTPSLPTFLAPYMHDHVRKTAHTDTLAAFSSAATGPLPLVRPVKRRGIYQMNHLTILGLAASFLILLMAGGLTSLLLLANQGSNGNIASTTNSNITSVDNNQVSRTTYTAPAAFPNVASALAVGKYIYYTAYNSNQTSWMLEQFNTQTKTSTPLFDVISTSPVILLGDSNNWLVWLQTDTAKALSNKTSTHTQTTTEQPMTWSLHSQYLGTTPVQPSSIEPGATALYSDTLNFNTVPSWVRTPVQGIAITQNALLVALIDAKGTSHLWSYALDNRTGKIAPKPTELDSASNGHILASPTATSDGSDIYWSEEWWSPSDNALNSDIWTQQLQEAVPDRTGRWAPHLNTVKYLFRADGHSFRPQLVQDMLFLLDTNTANTASAPTVTPQPTATTVQPTGTAQPAATPTSTATPAPINAASVLGGSVRIDPTIYSAQADTMTAGQLLAFSANGALSLPTPSDTAVSALQGGSRFLVWQNSAGEFQMYDVVLKAPVIIEGTTVPKDAAFLAVNGNTAVWVENVNTASNQNNQQNAATINFGTFTWPVPLKTAAGS